MAVIKADGTVRGEPRLLEGHPGGKIDGMRAVFADLAQLFGPTDTVEETRPQWIIRVESRDDRPTELVQLWCDDERARAYRHTLFWWTLSYSREGAWAADVVRETITAFANA